MESCGNVIMPLLAPPQAFVLLKKQIFLLFIITPAINPVFRRSHHFLKGSSIFSPLCRRQIFNATDKDVRGGKCGNHKTVSPVQNPQTQEVMPEKATDRSQEQIRETDFMATLFKFLDAVKGAPGSVTVGFLQIGIKILVGVVNELLFQYADLAF